MSEIIDTGLGWYANEDWLMDEPGYMGKIAQSGSDSTLPFPIFNHSNITYQEVMTYGANVAAGYKILLWYQRPKASSKLIFYKNSYSIYPVSFILLDVVYGNNTLQTAYVTPNSGTSIRGVSGSGYPQQYRGLYYWEQYLDGFPNINELIASDYWYIATATTPTGAIDEFLGSVDTNFYKFSSGFAITCFMKWVNLNQQTVTAPITISTDITNIPMSLDNQSEASGIVTGIEFGDMMFYINILSGYKGDVTSNVPYQDITEIYPDGINISELFRAIVTLAQVRFTDPYAEGGHSEPGGGGGTFDFSSDHIPIPSLPTISFAATGFTRIYNPTLSELNALANYLWTDTTFLDTVINHLKQLLENPMDAVISLSLLPCSIPNGSPESVKVMYINTGVTMAPATTQFVDVDCGTYFLEEAYGSALDYNPYTKVHCYLPYIGQVTLDTDEVMGKILHVKYRIDIVTGMCAAIITVNQTEELEETALYQFSGHCSINMPINSADFSGYISAAMTAGKMVAGVVAGATGNIPLAAELIGAPAPHSSTTETKETVTTRNPKTGRQNTQWSDTKSSVHKSPGASFGELSRRAAANTVGSVMGSKITVEHAGGFTGNSGYLAVRRPYLIIERPRMCNPEEYGRYNGRPSMMYMSLGACSGYTEVQSIQFINIPATNPELAELSELLKSGVIF